MNLLLEDPWFNAMLDEAVAQHHGRFTQRQIRAFRSAMAFTFEAHPAARAILKRARPDLDRRLREANPELPFPPYDLNLH